MRNLILALSGLMVLCTPAWAETIVLKNAHILTAASPAEYEHGEILVEAGRIAAVGVSVDAPAGAKIVDLHGATVTPGLVLANTNLGTVEISSRANANDSASAARALSAGVDISYAVNPASTLFPVARSGGIAEAVVTPGGHKDAGRLEFDGQAAILQTADGGDMIVRPRAAVTLALDGSDLGRSAVFVQLREDLRDVRRFMKRKSSFEAGELKARTWSYADLEALARVVHGDVPLAVTVDHAADIVSLLAVAAEEKIKLILIGAEEGWLVADRIAAAHVPVIVDPTADLPANFSRMAASLKNAAVLSKAGVEVALVGSKAGHDARLLRYYAGLAVAHGLPYQDAVNAVTVNAARMWGETDFGQIAVGQKADLAIWGGDPFEPLTDLEALYIGGKPQSLTNRQTLLRDKYVHAHRSN